MPGRVLTERKSRRRFSPAFDLDSGCPPPCEQVRERLALDLPAQRRFFAAIPAVSIAASSPALRLCQEPGARVGRTIVSLSP
jgi:hypothetical protein